MDNNTFRFNFPTDDENEMKEYLESKLEKKCTAKITFTPKVISDEGVTASIEDLEIEAEYEEEDLDDEGDEGLDEDDEASAEIVIISPE